MPQPKKGPRLASDPAHQRSLLSNLAQSLFEHERIKTTEAKAKLLRPYAERLITKAKKGTVHHRRQVLSTIENRDIVHKLFSDIGPRFVDRNGGYTRILKLGPRNGDGAPMALIELVEDGGGADTTETAAEESGGRRRRLRAPRRRSESRELPQDKPARSRAAQAAAEGSGPGADVQPPPHVAGEEDDARRGAVASKAGDASNIAEAGVSASGPSEAEARRETRSDQENKTD